MSEPKTYTGVKQVGQGSWGGQSVDIAPDGTITYTPGPGSDPFAEGRTIQQSEGYEVDWALLKEVLWEDRFLLSAASLSAVLAYLVVRDPVKYAAIAQALAVGISETVKGIGEVVPG